MEAITASSSRWASGNHAPPATGIQVGDGLNPEPGACSNEIVEESEHFEDAVPTRYWHTLPDGRVQCDVCPRFCKLHEGQRGLCFVRGNKDGAIVLTTHGRSSGFCVDPIEKKPLDHFLPGTPILSFGTAGCNLACR